MVKLNDYHIIFNRDNYFFNYVRFNVFLFKAYYSENPDDFFYIFVRKKFNDFFFSFERSSKNKNATYMTSYNTIEKPKAVTIIKDFPREFFEFSHKAFPSFFIFIPKLFIFYDIFSIFSNHVCHKESSLFLVEKK